MLIQNGEQPEFAMPIPLRTDFDASLVRLTARKSKDGAQARRLLALAAIYEGGSRSEAARIGGVTVQIIRDWVVKFNASGPAGLIERRDRPHGSAPPIVSRLSKWSSEGQTLPCMASFAGA
jgi:hypothetical protein